jgi:ribonucleoside-diphosphate reductase beta chain
MNCNKIICVDHKPTEFKLFFGDYNRYTRIDKITYPQIKKLYETSEGNTWFFNEISYEKDIIGWKEIPKNAQNMFKRNITYQTLMDSGVTSIFHEIAKVASVSELQYLYNRIGIEENIHALSYSNALDTVFGPEAEEILDEIYTDPFIKKRMENEVDGSDKFLDLVFRQERTDDEAKKSLIELLGAVFLLEGIKFPFSFFVTWAINKAYDNNIQGMARLLKLIAWDEMTIHTTTGSTILNILRKDETQGFSHLFKDFDEFMYEFMKKTVNAELEWNEYLLQDGEIPGYNVEIGKHFIKYWADRRMKELKLQPIYNEKRSDIIDWYDRYRNLNLTTTALQEADATNYQKGKLQNDLDKFDI